jgi:hypothetical protein
MVTITMDETTKTPRKTLLCGIAKLLKRLHFSGETVAVTERFRFLPRAAILRNQSNNLITP